VVQGYEEVRLAGADAQPKPGHGCGGLVVAIKETGCKRCQRVFDSLVVLVAWRAWLQHNPRVFQAVSCTPTTLVEDIARRIELWIKAELIDRSCLAGDYQGLQIWPILSNFSEMWLIRSPPTSRKLSLFIKNMYCS
jgi:hypothetical protein